jgi:3-oxoacyl-[acyl-carrier-protein] synthase III
MAEFYRARISGTGSYLPEKKLTNYDLEKMVETNHDWIVERTGISHRHIANDDQATSDLAYEATLKALQAANLKVEDLDAILFATVSPDQVMPNTACVLQDRLGARRNIMALDISAACSGFIYGISVANQFIQTGTYKHILVIGAEVLHRLVNYKDRETCILFGDGAGACILSRSDDDQPSKIYSHHLGADGSIGDLFVLPAGGSRMPFSQEVLDGKMQYVKMKGREIFKNAVRSMTDVCELALKTNNMTIDDVHWLIPHQANIRILESVAKHFEFPLEKVIINIANTGNTSAATVIIALDEAIRDGRIQRGQNVLLTAFGAGLTMGSVLLKY